MWVLISVRCTGGVDHFRLMVKRSFVVTCETGAMVDSCNDWHFIICTICLLFIFPCYYQCAELCPTKVLNMALVDLAP